ncbi:Helix-turn-helix [Lachnospiraceae bacterium]|nr:Helix-turn-helix [Lachnospiraceae bacterium]
MSKAVNPDFEFNKEEFSELLEKAKGGRSQNEFARDCGISPAYLNRYIKKKVEKPPIPSTINKIAKASVNNIAYKDFLFAAGYDIGKYPESYPNINKDKLDPIKDRLVYLAILNEFTQFEEEWKVSIPSPQKNYDFLIIIDNDKINKWYFAPTFNETFNTEDNIFTKYYSKILSSGADSQSKYSFVTFDSNLLERLCQNPPHLLNLLVSVILMDENYLTLKKEVYLESSSSYDDTVKNSFRLVQNN